VVAERATECAVAWEMLVALAAEARCPEVAGALYVGGRTRLVRKGKGRLWLFALAGSRPCGPCYPVPHLPQMPPAPYLFVSIASSVSATSIGVSASHVHPNRIVCDIVFAGGVGVLKLSYSGQGGREGLPPAAALHRPPW